jgi:adenylate cyclase
MKRKLIRIAICAAIAVGSVFLTVGLGNVRFFQLLNLKARDSHFVFRGKVPVKDIVIVGIDDKTNDTFPELQSFWQRYYADAMRGAALGGAKVFVLDATFAVPVEQYVPGNDSYLAQAYAELTPTMPIVAAYVAEAMASQQDARFAVPLNMMSAALGGAGFANMTADTDDFIRRQELIEEPKAGVPTEALARSESFRAAEKFLGQDAQIKDGELYLAGHRIPGNDRTIVINYAGPPGTVPRVPLYKFYEAYKRHDTKQLESWVKGKIVMLGPDNSLTDRYDTPFYTFASSGKATTPGVEIHANTLNTILTRRYLQSVPQWVEISGLITASAACVAIVTSLTVAQGALWWVVLVMAAFAATHLIFLQGWLFSTSETVLTMTWSLIGGIIYRFATAEKKSTFFRSAVALFVGREVATSLDQNEKIDLTGERRMVTILFTDIRGFTAFCESKDPAVVVDLLNVYMSKMVSIIVKYHGHVNKFIGDGILAVFSDDDPGAIPGDHALRTTRCATEMVSEVVGEFRTGAGYHTGEVVIGNVGSSDKLEFTVLGNTVNLASRLESLNKDQHTRLLMSQEANEMLRGEIDTIYLGSAPVKGKTERMKLYTVTSLLDDARIAELRASDPELKEEHKEQVV